MSAGPEATINQLVKQYLQAYGETPNTFNYNRTKLEFRDVKWNDRTPVTDHQGISRSVAVDDSTASSGNVSVTLNQAVITVRVHLTAGRFASGDQKLARLRLPNKDVFSNFDSIEFDANKDKSDAIQRTVPVRLVDRQDLSSFRNVRVESSTTMFEGDFECTAVLSGTVITNRGGLQISNIVQHFGSRLPPPFSAKNDYLSWPVKGIAEFVLDTQSRVN